MGRVLGFGVSVCQMYGCRGQRHHLNLCVSPSLPELECLCISEGQNKVKGVRVGSEGQLDLERDREIVR